jgi:hypothetical protein
VKSPWPSDYLLSLRGGRGTFLVVNIAAISNEPPANPANPGSIAAKSIR